MRRPTTAMAQRLSTHAAPPRRPLVELVRRPDTGAPQLQFAQDPSAKRPRGSSSLSPLEIDFTSPALHARFRSMVQGGDALLRAIDVGRKPPDGSVTQNERIVVDATAGLGRDSAALAFAAHQYGAHWLRVVMIERSPLLCELLRHALDAGRAAHQAWLSRLSLIEGNSLQLLEQAQLGETPSLGATPSVIYMDPMFTEEPGGEEQAKHRGPRRTALPQRELQFIAALAGPSTAIDNERLLRAALRVASERVVVKRHHGAPPIGFDASASQRALAEGTTPLPRPSHAVESGKAVRYDVYLR